MPLLANCVNPGSVQLFYTLTRNASEAGRFSPLIRSTRPELSPVTAIVLPIGEKCWLGAAARFADPRAVLPSGWVARILHRRDPSETTGIGDPAEIHERDNMRQIIWGFIALAVIAAMSNPASARDRQSRRSSQSVQQSDRPGLFGGLIEMERRKNAWLRQSLGR